MELLYTGRRPRDQKFRIQGSNFSLEVSWELNGVAVVESMQTDSSKASTDFEWDSSAERRFGTVGAFRFSHSWLSRHQERFFGSVRPRGTCCKVHHRIHHPFCTSLQFSMPRYAKKGSVESSCSDLALNTLHKRVTPFIMRRTKDEVLQDLPPKIIQDVYCDISPIQRALYEDYTKLQVCLDSPSKKSQWWWHSSCRRLRQCRVHLFSPLDFSGSCAVIRCLH